MVMATAIVNLFCSSRNDDRVIHGNLMFGVALWPLCASASELVYAHGYGGQMTYVVPDLELTKGDGLNAGIGQR